MAIAAGFMLGLLKKNHKSKGGYRKEKMTAAYSRLCVFCISSGAGDSLRTKP